MPNLGDYDVNAKPQKPEIWLAKPDKTLIAKLNNRSNISFTKYGKRNHFTKFTQQLKLGNPNIIEFSLPYDVEIDHVYQKNPIIDEVLERYLLKVIDGTVEKWYVIVKVNKTMDEQKDVKTVTAYSLEYELKNKIVRSWKITSANFSQFLNGGITVDQYGNTVSFDGLLKDTLWSAGNIDNSFNTIYRAIDISSSNVGDTLIQLAKTFNGVLTFDTVNRLVNLYPLASVGQDRGLKVSYGNLMRAMDNESNTDTMVTRLKPFGKNGLDITSVNPTGSDSIDDFSFFLAGYATDSNGTVISHSSYMSDGLCAAIIAYNKKVNDNKANYKSLLSQLSSLQSTLTTQQNDLATLQTQLNQINDSIFVAQTTNQDTTSLQSQKLSKQTDISNKQNDITNTNNQITNVQNQINAIVTSLSDTNNFTSAQITERNQFILEKEWTDNNYYDAQNLYDDAVTKLQTLNYPQITCKVDLVNLREIISEQNRWGKLNLGDIIYIEYDKLNINIQARIIEIDFDHNEGNITVTISNEVDLSRDKDKLVQMIYSGTSASNSINVNKYLWDSVGKVQNDVDGILNNAWDAAKRSITSGDTESVKIDNTGITIKDTQNSNNIVRMDAGYIALSSDGGATYKTAISAAGIFASELVGQILAGENLTITTGAGDFLVNQNGVTIDGTRLTITNGYHGGITSATLGNGITLDSMNGIVATRSDSLVQVSLSATNGLEFFKNTGSVGSPTWTPTLYANTNGDVTVNGIINAKDLQINGTSVLNGNTINGSYVSNISAGSITTGSLSANFINGGTINANNVTITNLNASNIVSGSLNGITMAIGSGNSIFKADTNGIYLGNSTFGSAPFRVDMTGAVTASNISITGGSINVGTNATVGTNLYLGSLSDPSAKYIQFNSGASIEGLSYSSDIQINANHTFVPANFSAGGNGYTVSFYGDVDFSSATSVKGVVAVFG